MKIYQNLTIIGTSHIAKQSIKEVKDTISLQTPEVVALELDKSRLLALIHDGKTRNLTIKEIFQIGIKGFVFGIIGKWVEHKVGKLVGTKPGDEMKQAVKTAKKFECKIALIDQRIEVTLKKLSKAITWKEKFRFLADLIKAPFQKKKIPFDLNKVPSEKLIKDLLNQTKERYPNVYKVLVADRNKYMAKRLYRLMQEYNSIIAVVGAGHTDEIIQEIKCLQKKS